MDSSKRVTADEVEARHIAEASPDLVREVVRQSILQRRLSPIVAKLNNLEREPRTRDLARKALQRLGFPIGGNSTG